VLWSGEGLSDSDIAARLDRSKATVGKWRQRFVKHRIQGIYDGLRPGRPRTISDEKVASLLRRTLKAKPPPFTGCFRPLLCSPIARRPSSCPTIRFLWRR
jgi:putative transposase